MRKHDFKDPKTGRLLPRPDRFWPVQTDCVLHSQDTVRVELPTRSGATAIVDCEYCCFSWMATLLETRDVEKHRIGP